MTELFVMLHNGDVCQESLKQRKGDKMIKIPDKPDERLIDYESGHDPKSVKTWRRIFWIIFRGLAIMSILALIWRLHK